MDSDSLLECADLVMDDDAHRVRRAGVDVSLSPTEYNLLRYLLVNQGRVVSKAQILDHVWRYDFGGDGSVVETYIGYLRRKVDDVEPKLIHTLPRRRLHPPRPVRTLRTRLLVGIAFVAVVLVVVALVVTATTRNQLIGQIDDRLASFSPGGHDLTGREGGNPRGEPPPPPPDGTPERPSDAFQGYVDADGNLVTLFAPNVGDEDYTAPDIRRRFSRPKATTTSPSTRPTAGARIGSSPRMPAMSRRLQRCRSTTCNGRSPD